MPSYDRIASNGIKGLRLKSSLKGFSEPAFSTLISPCTLHTSFVKSRQSSSGVRQKSEKKKKSIHRGKETQLSTVARGNLYEEVTKKFLSKPPFMVSGLIKVGGADDRGVDLRGWLSSNELLQSSLQLESASSFPSTSTVSSSVGSTLESDSSSSFSCFASSSKQPPFAPSLSPSTNGQTNGSPPPSPRWGVIVQCKAEAKPLGPSHIRELEGVLANETYAPNIPGKEARNRLYSGIANHEVPPQHMENVPVGLESTSSFTSSLASTSSTTPPTSPPFLTLSKTRPSAVGILVSEGGFSIKARMRAQSSNWPIGLVHLKKDDELYPAAIASSPPSHTLDATTMPCSDSNIIPGATRGEKEQGETISDSNSSSTIATTTTAAHLMVQPSASQSDDDKNRLKDEKHVKRSLVESPYRASSLLWNETLLSLLGRHVFKQSPNI